jgi:hypothetical protein
MRRYRAPQRGQGIFFADQSSADCITNMSGFVRQAQAFSSHGAALAYWRGDYVAIDREEELARLADVSLPVSHAHQTSPILRSQRDRVR